MNESRSARFGRQQRPLGGHFLPAAAPGPALGGADGDAEKRCCDTEARGGGGGAGFGAGGVGLANAAGGGVGFGGDGGGGAGFVNAAAGVRVDGESVGGVEDVGFVPVLVVGRVATGGFDGDCPLRFCSVVVGDVGVSVCFVLSVLAGGFVPIAAVPLPACGSVVPPAPGKAFCLGMVDPCSAVLGARLAGVAPAPPGFAVALIEALGGVGSLPCWISDARCATAGGSDGPTAPCWRPAAATGAGLLMTVLMTVVLWMLLKMMLLAGAAT